MEHLTLLVKPASSLCDLRCRYCFYEDVSDSRQVKNMGRMTEETARRLLTASVQAVGAQGSMQITFQGGEPTLAGLEFYRSFLALEGQICPSSLRITHSIQTNGMTLDREWADFLGEHGFLVGLSLDGAREFHDTLRVDPRGKGTWDRAVRALALLDGIYSTVVVRDILERERRRGQRQITDPDLLRKIIMFLADNIGNSTSITSISNTLVNEKLLDQSRKGNPSVHTIQAYVGALLESYIFYEIKRFDIKGKEYLRTLGKYYIVDIGLRNYLLGFRDMDTGHIIENIVYFELLRRGYDVSIGKVDNKEVDFIAANAEQKRYIQVTESMNEPTTRERELAPLRMIRDNYEKIVIAGNCNHPITEDGIKIIRLTDFLLDT